MRIVRVLVVALALSLVALITPTPAAAYWYGPPQNLTSSDLGGGRTQFSWNAPNPVNYQGVAPTSYYVTVTSGYRSYYCEGAASSSIVTGTSCIISGLPYGVSVTLKVEAWNPYMSDDAQATFTLCCDLPAAPAGVSARSGDTTASVAWNPPSNKGPAGQDFTYSVEIRPGGKVCSTTGLSCDVAALTNGVAYTFFVTASNKTGTGPAATSAPVNPIGRPSAPMAVQAFLGKGEALVAWQGPTNTGGATISRYVVTSTAGGLTCETSGALECTVTGLANGSDYAFTVTAFNAAGQSDASAASASAKLLALPSPPTAVRAQKKGMTVVLTWKAPRSTGGSKIRGYVVTSSPTGKKCATRKELTCTITGIKVGSTFVFSVQAQNGTGLGAPGRSNSVYFPVPPPPPPPPKQEETVR